MSLRDLTITPELSIANSPVSEDESLLQTRTRTRSTIANPILEKISTGDTELPLFEAPLFRAQYCPSQVAQAIVEDQALLWLTAVCPSATNFNIVGVIEHLLQNDFLDSEYWNDDVKEIVDCENNLLSTGSMYTPTLLMPASIEPVRISYIMLASSYECTTQLRLRSADMALRIIYTTALRASDEPVAAALGLRSFYLNQKTWCEDLPALRDWQNQQLVEICIPSTLPIINSTDVWFYITLYTELDRSQQNKFSKSTGYSSLSSFMCGIGEPCDEEMRKCIRQDTTAVIYTPKQKQNTGGGKTTFDVSYTNVSFVVLIKPYPGDPDNLKAIRTLAQLVFIRVDLAYQLNALANVFTNVLYVDPTCSQPLPLTKLTPKKLKAALLRSSDPGEFFYNLQSVEMLEPQRGPPPSTPLCVYLTITETTIRISHKPCDRRQMHRTCDCCLELYAFYVHLLFGPPMYLLELFPMEQDVSLHDVSSYVNLDLQRSLKPEPGILNPESRTGGFFEKLFDNFSSQALQQARRELNLNIV
jgi:hypothetical protein